MKKTLLFAMCLLGFAALPVTAQEPGQLHQQACDDGDAYACNVLALMYEVGQEVEPDIEVAAALYERACEGGETGACNSIGAMYQMGIGVPVDIGRSVSLYEDACFGDALVGCESLGMLYERGQGRTHPREPTPT